MDYFQLQEVVFNHLTEKNKKDSTFTFSVRQMAKKGAEKNHFIGTIKSRYFGFTCWDIPVYYPGSSSDLTNFIFYVEEGHCFLKFQYVMAKSATGPQSQGDLDFGYALLKNLEAAGIKVSNSDEKNKMLYYYVELHPEGYSEETEVLQAFEELYELVAPIVDASLKEMQPANPEWQAGRYSNEKFNTLIDKMHHRIQRFSNASPQEIDSLPEEDDLLIESKVTFDISVPPLNTILYGPPGTGKTYTTVNKAVQIANPSFFYEQRTREEIRNEYKRLKAEGQIEFITFHQSMTYEDFIEGIKPVEPEEGDRFLKYKVQKGIFKLVAERASYKEEPTTSRFSLDPAKYEKASFYKLSLGNPNQPEKKDVYNHCLNNNCITIGWGDAMDFSTKSEAEITQMGRDKQLSHDEALALNGFIHLLKKDNYVLLTHANIIRAIGQVTGDYYYNENDVPSYYHYRPVQWLVKNVEIPVSELYNKPFGPRTIYRLDKEEIKKDFFVKSAVEILPERKTKNFVLIIDEINRGNISAIFGELITLIEDDKRKDCKEALEVMLPYSKELFSVPSNLFIIGTMNTADRSVEALDTALRRRFSFIEMQADANHTSLDTSVTIAGTSFNFGEVLATINKRLEKLIGRDHQIGHSYFIPKNDWTWENYLAAFINKIIPLLQEYFYGDYAKMCLVVGKGFVNLKAEVSAADDIAFFAAADHEALDSLFEKPVWRIQPIETEAAFANALNLLLNKY